MKMIGTDNFIAKYVGEAEGDYNRVLNQYVITSTNGLSQQFLNVNEDQVDELIELLQKIKEVL